MMSWARPLALLWLDVWLRHRSGRSSILRINRLAESVWEIDEVEPTSVRLTTSHFDTAARG
jgi:hypothetical protein